MASLVHFSARGVSMCKIRKLMFIFAAVISFGIRAEQPQPEPPRPQPRHNGNQQSSQGQRGRPQAEPQDPKALKSAKAIEKRLENPPCLKSKFLEGSFSGMCLRQDFGGNWSIAGRAHAQLEPSWYTDEVPENLDAKPRRALFFDLAWGRGNRTQEIITLRKEGCWGFDEFNQDPQKPDHTSTRTYNLHYGKTSRGTEYLILNDTQVWTPGPPNNRYRMICLLRRTS
jgi:hypothetical protein